MHAHRAIIRKHRISFPFDHNVLLSTLSTILNSCYFPLTDQDSNQYNQTDNNEHNLYLV